MATRKSTILGRAILIAALLGPGLAAAQAPTGGDRSVEDKTPGSRFRCQDGGDLQAQFKTEGGRLVAIVDALDGDGPHTLPWTPYDDGPPVKITWSDGRRTLTWSPGVQLMWMDAAVHRMCGRAGHHH